MGQGQTQERRPRTGLLVTADDGTVATVHRIAQPTVLGLTPRFRMYRAEIHPVEKAASEVTLSRPLLKQLLKGGARIVRRVA